jgi:DNA-binding CsgD family transcriptional regulator
VSSPQQAFEHRIAAADHYDDALALELDEFARTLHADGAFRDAGRLLRAASEATSEPSLRESRWLDSLFELLLARDFDAVDAEQFDISWARDSPRRALVQGFSLMLKARWTQAFTIFDSLDANQLESTEPLVQLRLLTLTGWTAISMGRPGEEVLPGLRRALELEALDPSVGSYLTLAHGQAQMRVAERGALWGFEDAPNNGPRSDTAPTGGRLVWRGAVYAFSGREDEAIRDLTAYTDGIRDGVVALGDGAPHALLGFALWMRGDLRLAAIPLRIARDAQYGSGHPMVLAVEALAALAEGDEAAVLDTIRAARDLLMRAPWPQAVTTALIVETIALRLFGSQHQRADFLSGFRADFGLGAEKGLVPPLRLLHLSLAEVWASDFDSALGHARELEELPINLPWRAAAAEWIRGLVELGRGNATAATGFLASAARAQLGGLPVHQALLFADMVDAAAALSDSASLERARHHYASALIALGLDRFAPRHGEEYTEQEARGAVWSSLTDREREVVALVLEGLSYAQIAKELFLTRSTVAFHLSNAYAKTNTTSRHELVNLIRSERGA